MNITLDKSAYKARYFVFKVVLRLMKVFRINFFRMYDQHLRSTNTLSGEGPRKEFYLSSIPDRYSDNFQAYGKGTNFLEHGDMDAWLQGNYKNNVGDLTRYYFLNLCLDYLIEDGIAGDVAELGVFRGNSAFLLAKFARRMGRECLLFDTFEGFDARDLEGKDAQVNKHTFENTSLGYVKSLVGEEGVTYVKGYFPDSLVQLTGEHRYSLVHIDCDLEKPVEEALKYFYPRMNPGGFLVLHDHSSLYWPGAEDAINRFFSDKPEKPIPVPDKSGTCVIRKVS